MASSNGGGSQPPKLRVVLAATRDRKPQPSATLPPAAPKPAATLPPPARNAPPAAAAKSPDFQKRTDPDNATSPKAHTQHALMPAELSLRKVVWSDLVVQLLMDVCRHVQDAASAKARGDPRAERWHPAPQMLTAPLTALQKHRILKLFRSQRFRVGKEDAHQHSGVTASDALTKTATTRDVLEVAIPHPLAGMLAPTRPDSHLKWLRVVADSEREGIIRSMWWDPDKGAFRGSRGLHALLSDRYMGISMQHVKEFMSKQEMRQVMQKSMHGTFLPIVPTGIGHHQIDLIVVKWKRDKGPGRAFQYLVMSDKQQRASVAGGFSSGKGGLSLGLDDADEEVDDADIDVLEDPEAEEYEEMFGCEMSDPSTIPVLDRLADYDLPPLVIRPTGAIGRAQQRQPCDDPFLAPGSAQPDGCAMAGVAEVWDPKWDTLGQLDGRGEHPIQPDEVIDLTLDEAIEVVEAELEAQPLRHVDHDEDDAAGPGMWVGAGSLGGGGGRGLTRGMMKGGADDDADEPAANPGPKPATRAQILQDPDRNGIRTVYIMTVIDIFSKHLWAFVLTDKTSVTVASKLEELWLREGPPEVLQSDQGTEFKGPAMKLLCRRFNVKRRLCRPYRSQCNGVVERVNRTVQDFINRVAYYYNHSAGSALRWSQILQHVIYHYNTARHRTTHLSPYVIYRGREPPALGPLIWNNILLERPADVLVSEEQRAAAVLRGVEKAAAAAEQLRTLQNDGLGRGQRDRRANTMLNGFDVGGDDGGGDGGGEGGGGGNGGAGGDGHAQRTARLKQAKQKGKASSNRSGPPTPQSMDVVAATTNPAPSTAAATAATAAAAATANLPVSGTAAPALNPSTAQAPSAAPAPAQAPAPAPPKERLKSASASKFKVRQVLARRWNVFCGTWQYKVTWQPPHDDDDAIEWVGPKIFPNVNALLTWHNSPAVVVEPMAVDVREEAQADYCNTTHFLDDDAAEVFAVPYAGPGPDEPPPMWMDSSGRPVVAAAVKKMGEEFGDGILDRGARRRGRGGGITAGGSPTTLMSREHIEMEAARGRFEVLRGGIRNGIGARGQDGPGLAFPGNGDDEYTEPRMHENAYLLGSRRRRLEIPDDDDVFSPAMRAAGRQEIGAAACVQEAASDDDSTRDVHSIGRRYGVSRPSAMPGDAQPLSAQRDHMLGQLNHVAASKAAAERRGIVVKGHIQHAADLMVAKTEEKLKGKLKPLVVKDLVRVSRLASNAEARVLKGFVRTAGDGAMWSKGIYRVTAALADGMRYEVESVAPDPDTQTNVRLVVPRWFMLQVTQEALDEMRHQPAYVPFLL